jgi:RNA polymerase sigma factor (sigma-70 family)
MNEVIEKSYRKNFNKYVLQMEFRAGSYQDAEDIVQDSYEKALRYFNSYDPSIDFEKWLNTIRYNCLKDHRKKERGYVMEEFEEYNFEGTPCQQYNDEERMQIERIIEAKPEAQREIINLYFNKNYSARDIAAVTEHLYITAWQCIRRFREEIKDYLE